MNSTRNDETNADPKELYQEDYDEKFKHWKIQRAALEESIEIRKFEIELYWKRAAYFWTFIGAAFVAYGTFLNLGKNSSSENPDEKFLLLIISWVGFIFSVAWFYVNRGSKYWQENWENHVELLEDAIIGPLYKTRTSRPKNDKESSNKTRSERIKNFISRLLIDPIPISVSKINQLVSAIVAAVWFIILAKHTIPGVFKGILDLICPVLVLAIAVAIFPIFCWLGRTNLGEHSPYVYLRKTNLRSSPSASSNSED